MYAAGQTVLYGANGVCRISEITTRRIGKETIEYYVLKPMGAQASTVYVPTKNEELVGRMRAVMTESEIRALLSADSSLRWIDNNAERFEFFHAVLARGDCGELMGMVRLMRARQRRLLDMGRHLHLTDERQLREAEKMAGEEVAAALGVDVQDALRMILDKATE